MRGQTKTLLQCPDDVLLMSTGWVDPAVVTGHDSAAFAPDIREAAQFPVCRALGFTSGDIEVKADEKARETGNLYLEFEQQGVNPKPGTPFRPSGFASTDAELWVHAAGLAAHTLLVFLLPVERLRSHVEHSDFRVVLTPSDCPTHGWLLPLSGLISEPVSV